MLGNLFRKPDDEKIKKDMEKARDKIIRQSVALRQLEKSEGWSEYVSLLQDYVQACKRRKAVTALDTADDKTLAQLKLLDHEVWLIETFILKIPAQMIGLEESSKEKQEVLDD
jgi:hypothetical protein